MSDVVVDADGEVVLQRRLGQLRKDAIDHRRRELFRREAVTPANHFGEGCHRRFAGGEAFGQRDDDILVERLADSAGLFGAIEYGNALDRLGQRFEEVFQRERPHQADFQHADFLALRGEMVDRLVDRFGAGAHDDDDSFGIGRAFILEELVLAANQLGELVHRVLHDGGTSQVIRIHRLAALEVNVGILRRAAQYRMVGRQGALAMGAYQIVVDHGLHVVEAELFDLGNFVRGAEAVEEMQEGNARFQRRGVRDQRQVHGFLYRVGRQQGKSGGADGHGVLVVAEDRQRLGGEGAGGNVNDAWASVRPRSCTCWGSSAAGPATR